MNHVCTYTYKESNCDNGVTHEINLFRVTINNMLISLDMPLECGRVVTTDGSCFYDSVLANLEEPEIRQSIASHVRTITPIQDLWSSLAHFMETNTMLHGLQQFQMQRDINRTDKKLTWTRYLEEIK